MFHFPEVLLLNDITCLTAEDLLARNVRLLGLDIENVLTDYKGASTLSSPEVRPEVREHLGGLASTLVDLDFVLISNAKDGGFVREVSEELGNTPFIYKDGSFKGKASGDMFVAAATDFLPAERRYDGERTYTAAHVDDQSKTYLGLTRAAWETFIWTKPFGAHQHPGVKRMRPVEAVLRTGLHAKHMTELIRPL